PPLTELIDTFVSAAGANHGSVLCVVPIPVGTWENRSTLLTPHFLQDINNQAGYRGNLCLSVFSQQPMKSLPCGATIGFRTCGKPVSPIRGGTGYVKKDGLSHDQVMDGTHHLQMNFMTIHAPK
ncbi:hypothetical protein OSTOST_15819, partial [Ostertagia ostertagi]